MTNELDTTFRATDTRNKRVIEWLENTEENRELITKESELLIYLNKDAFDIANYQESMFGIYYFYGLNDCYESDKVDYFADISELAP